MAAEPGAAAVGERCPGAGCEPRQPRRQQQVPGAAGGTGEGGRGAELPAPEVLQLSPAACREESGFGGRRSGFCWLRGVRFGAGDGKISAGGCW